MAAVIQRASNQVACDMGGEIVVLDLKSGCYYGLDAVGARVWTLIEQPASLNAIRDAIIAEYEIDAQSCEHDIQAFLEKMHAAGLVEITNDSRP